MFTADCVTEKLYDGQEESFIQKFYSAGVDLLLLLWMEARFLVLFFATFSYKLLFCVIWMELLGEDGWHSTKRSHSGSSGITA